MTSEILLNLLELPAGFRINAKKVIIVQHVLLTHARGLQGTNIIQKGLREISLKSLQLPSAFRINAWKVILLLNARTWVAKTLTELLLKS